MLIFICNQATVPQRYKERGKSPGQPMKSHALTSRCLPLIYINTSVIRVFCPRVQDKHSASGLRATCRFGIHTFHMGAVAIRVYSGISRSSWIVLSCRPDATLECRELVEVLRIDHSHSEYTPIEIVTLS